MCEALSSQLKNCGYEPSPKCLATQGIGVACAVTLLVIGILAVIPGVSLGSHFGYIAAGVAGLGFALNIAGGNLDERKWELLIAAIATLALLALGFMNGLGLLSTTHLGIGILVTSVVSAITQVVVKKAIK